MPFSPLWVRLKVSRKKTYLLDGISWSLMIFCVLFSAYFTAVGVNVNIEIGFKAIFMAFLVFMGLAGYMARFGKPKTDNVLTASETATIASSTILGFCAIALIQTAIFKGWMYIRTPAVLDLWSARLLVGIIAIGEETFFRYFLQSTLENQLIVTNSKYPEASAILLISLVFMIFHYIYHGQPEVLFAMFCSSIVLGVVYAVTKRLSVVQLIHFTLNEFAVR